MGTIRPFVQGPRPLRRGGGVQFAIALIAAFVTAASLMTLILTEVSVSVAALLPQSALLLLLAAVASAGVLVDIRAIRKRRLSAGISRQTPKTLLHIGEHAWITPLVWGFDAGLIWTTYRVSFASWVMLLSAATGIAPPWVGTVYGLFFGVPLLVMLFLPAGRLLGRFMSSLVPVQSLGIAAMAAMVIVALKGTMAGA